MANNASLADCAGALAHLRTPDESARRRYPPEKDDDGWLEGHSSPFAVDADHKVLLSKALRREAGKTQVYIDAQLHVRTRLTHTLEVVTVATAIARVLGLNMDLTRAGALAHDIGHAPLGHLGEEVIQNLAGRLFRHETFGVVVAQRVERRGRGLNLARQTLEVILRHSRGDGELSAGPGGIPEATVVMCADKLAYLFGDLNDTERCYRPLADYPDIARLAASFGSNQRARTRACVEALCRESAEKGRVSFSSCDEAQRFSALKKRMYVDIYRRLNDERRVDQARLQRAYEIIGEMEAPSTVDPAVILALMTDTDVRLLADSTRMTIPVVWRQLSVYEIIPHLRGRNIDFADPDLDW